MQHDEAARARSKWSFDLNLTHIGFRRERKAPDYSNLRDLAMRSADVVSDNTGNIENPGVYIRDQLEMHYGVFRPLLGWNGGHVACYRGLTTTEDGKSVFVALFGSASNVVGWRPSDERTSGFYPSDMQGLYSLLDTVREHGDPEIDLDYRIDDYGLPEEARADTAILFATEGATKSLGRLDALIRPFIEINTHDSRRGQFQGRVIVGAPVWIATLPPAPYRGRPKS
jgi:hypothetical protein